MEIWCNEAQERYVLALVPGTVAQFAALCERERCPFAVVGEITGDGRLLDSGHRSAAVGRARNAGRHAHRGAAGQGAAHDPRCAHRHKSGADVVDRRARASRESSDRLLCLPTIADKSFLITIGDRTVGGMISRDQMVGPWQVPVADVAVSLNSYDGYGGEAMAMGERTPVAVLNAPASGRSAVGEAITNIVAADMRRLTDIRLSANWMAACGEPGEDADLYATVRAVGVELCADAGITIPVGKDSLSMRTAWPMRGATFGDRSRVADRLGLCARRGCAAHPDAGIGSVAALAPAADRFGRGQESAGRQLLGAGAHSERRRAGGSRQPGSCCCFFVCRIARTEGSRLLLAYHDRSDGGVLLTVLEMAFAATADWRSISGQRWRDPSSPPASPRSLGAVLQVPAARARGAMYWVAWLLRRQGLGAADREIGESRCPACGGTSRNGNGGVFGSRLELHRRWSEVSFRMQEMRDNPDCAREEYSRLADAADPGCTRAELRSEGGRRGALHLERRAARGRHPARAGRQQSDGNGGRVHARGFRCLRCAHDRYPERARALGRFHGLVACGGFSYGDVLGAGEGWAKSILFNARAREQFAAFFARATFTLGVCNGCQMLSALKELIPGRRSGRASCAIARSNTRRA
jgi:phosphoribosylformylglycinamidine synthase